MEFKRGDTVTHYFKLPIASYVAGSFLFFAAKPLVDNDTADTAAVINKKFTDSSVNLVSNPGYATYTLTFVPADIVGVTFLNGESEKDYLGEFQFIAPSANPISFPANNKYITVKIYADIRLAIT